MKHLRFNFCHPIKGHACISRLLTERPDHHNLTIDSKESTLVEIPISELSEGKWRIVLDWEHNGQLFSHQKDFEIRNSAPFI